MTIQFSGFPVEALQFLADLAENNDKEWFNAHKKTVSNLFAGTGQGVCAGFG